MRRRDSLKLLAGALSLGGAMLGACAPARPLVPSAGAERTSTDGSAAAAPSTGSATRTIQHALGSTAVTLPVRRPIVLDALDNALALGVKPVGAAQWIGAESGRASAFPSYLGDQADGVEFLGQAQTPNLERIARLRPDLIVGRKNFHEGLHGALSQIAPTVIFDVGSGGVEWERYFMQMGEALDRKDAADAAMDRFAERASAIRQRLAEQGGGPTVSIMRLDPGRVVVYHRDFFAGRVLQQAGVRRPPSQDGADATTTLSAEQISQMDGDVILMIEGAPSPGSALSRLRSNPLWATLQAARSGRVYEPAFEVWIAGWTITGANLILDDLERYLLA